ncbi:MAG: flagellar biosynthetic protein FliR [Bryobacteraceae bacterium]
MPAEFTALLYGFLLVLARVSGVFAFVPFPGFQSGPPVARVVLSLLITLALLPRWPAFRVGHVDTGLVILWMLAEAAAGVVIGLAVALMLEVFVTAAQVVSLNAGFSFASTFDPATQAESGVLLIVAQLAGGLVFFALGLDREVIRTLADSLQMHPAGVGLPRAAGPALIALGAGMFSLSLRLALPAAALLVFADLALGLFARLNAQLQLLSLAFPAKMMGSLLLLGWLTALLPRFLQAYAGTVFGVLRRLFCN